MKQAIAANYLSSLEKCLESFGVRHFLKNLGFDDKRVHDPQAFLTLEEFTRIVHAAYEQSQCAYLGLFFGQNITIVNHGFLGYAAMTSPTMGAAIQIMLRYLNTRTSLLQIDLHDAGPDKFFMELVLVPLEPLITRFIVEMVMMHIVKMRTFLINKTVPCLRIDVDYQQPSHADYYYRMLQTDVHFNSDSNRLWLAADELNYPVNFADDVSYQQARQQLQAVSDQLAAQEDLPSRIQMILLRDNLLDSSMEKVAAQLCMSSRTLRRHLQRCGISYQELVDSVRQQKAETFLRNNTMSVTEISFLLGFNDTSSFSKAFKRWTSYTPSDYRQRFSS
ncbi:AraC family transcriptional regulator [Legionella spiritensis]|uniref:AraC family transcriptional regulator n=1 Tax=Legionella spiritensis TaxID=452 RepID=UPI000F6E46B2|nr:AraC family transcriptional regulator [Legionella spiritensis]VEG92298.1 transcriptional regulator OruR, AraC family [Legionella spiritensis]